MTCARRSPRGRSAGSTAYSRKHGGTRRTRRGHPETRKFRGGSTLRMRPRPALRGLRGAADGRRSHGQLARGQRLADRASRGARPRGASIPARTRKRVAVWGCRSDICAAAETLLYVQADRVGGVCGARDSLIIRCSSLLGLHTVTGARSSQFGVGSLARDRTDRVAVSERRRLSGPVRASRGRGSKRRSG
jgi:hypothetical protein